MNKLAPFDTKQVKFYKRCMNSWFNVAEGGKRGGKNVLVDLAYCTILENHPNRLHLVGGYNISSAKLNILDCDGYGLLNYFEGRYKEGKYKNKDCLYINTLTGEKIILVTGGGKANDYKAIRGNTYGTAYITEANLCHPDFLQEVFDRTLSSDDRKIFHDLNPKPPKYWYYTDILDFHEKKQKENPNYGYNYGHFNIFNNLSITDEKLKKILDTYDKNSIWYKRDILGQRIANEGILFPDIANNPEKYMVDSINTNGYITVGIDFGGNGSGHAFTCSQIPRDFSKLTFINHKKVEIDNTAKMQQLIKEFKLFIMQTLHITGKIDVIFADSAEQLLIDALRTAIRELELHIPVKDSIKTEINDRIHIYNLLAMQNRLNFYRGHTEQLVEAFSEAVQDEKAVDDRWLDDGTSDIDSMDSATYSCEYYYDQLAIKLI